MPEFWFWNFSPPNTFNRLKLTQTKHFYQFIFFVRNQEGHIPREISGYVYHFIKTEGGFVNGSVISTKFHPLSIPSDVLEIPLLLKFSCPEQKTFEKMKNFFDSLYDYE